MIKENNKLKTSVAAIALAASFGLAAGGAQAQGYEEYGQQGGQDYYGGAEQHQQYAPPAEQNYTPPAQPSIDVSDEALAAFVSANIEVTSIMQDWQSSVAAGEAEQDDVAAQQEVQAEMISAVEEAGLTVQQYNQISEALQYDQSLQQRYQAMMQ